MGYHKAYGIDLNPGTENRWVILGDFMRLECLDSSLDLIYCNAVDHAFDLEGFFKEHARAIKENGYVLYELGLKNDNVFEAVSWKNDEEVILIMLKYFQSLVMLDCDPAWKWILLRGKRRE